MTEQVLLLNPRRGHRRQPAGLRRYWATRRRRLSNPRAHRRRHRSNARHRVRAYTERRRGRRVYVRSHMSNPRRHRRRRRNPREGTLLSDYLVPAGIGAVSAVALNMAWGYLSPSLPSSVQTGLGALAAQGAIVIVAGVVISRAMPRHSANVTAGVVGALTVVAYSAISQLMSNTSLGTGLSDYRRYRMGAYMQNPQAAPMTALPAPARARVPAKRRMGWVSPAPALRGIGAYMTYAGPRYAGARY